MTKKPVVQMVGGSKPFRILGPNANPDNPDLQDILFDANQQPLRLKQVGVLYVVNGPGFWSTAGAYGGVSTPINNPTPGKRHLATAVGYKDGVSIRIPCMMFGSDTIYAFDLYGGYYVYVQQGIGVITEADKVWALNNFTTDPVLGLIGTLPGPIPINITGVVGFKASPAWVSFMIYHNTVG